MFDGKVRPMPIPLCKKILPLVYDDSLSYYETICKFVQKLNEVIELCDGLGEDILEQAKAYTDTAIADTFADVDAKIAEVDARIAEVNRVIGEFEEDYANFTTYITGEMLNLSEYVDDSLAGFSALMDLKIQNNNIWLLNEIQESLRDILIVLNPFTGEYVTIQEMIDYLSAFHIVDGIDYDTMNTRALTYSAWNALNMTYTDLTLHGNTLYQ